LWTVRDKNATIREERWKEKTKIQGNVCRELSGKEERKKK
jgi:hypothetical protein